MRHRPLLLLVLLSVPSILSAQRGGVPSARLDSVAATIAATSVAPGMSVAIVRGRDTLLLRGYGWADVERRVAATDSTIYRIGSITKSFTAAATLRLVEEGRLNLAAPLSSVLADYAGPGRGVTIRHLLDHTSGIPSFTAMGQQTTARLRQATTRSEVQDLFERAPLEFEPGSSWTYNNSAYWLLGAVIEQASGTTYSAYLDSRIMAPARLRDTGECDDAVRQVRRAAGYDGRPGDLERAGPVTGPVPFSAGALCGTVRDLVTFQRALASGRIVSAGSYALMTAPSVTRGRPNAYGLGLEVTELGGHTRIGHGGSISGFDAYVAHYPADDLTIAILTNNTAANAEGIEKRFARLVLGVAETSTTRVPLATADRKRYVGAYEVGAGRLHIREQGETLRVSGPVDAELAYQGSHTFVLADEPDVRIVFTTDGDRVVGLEWTARGRTLRARKVE